MFDQIEKLKTDLTDKYVLVDETIPELARFEGHVGQVKTVNMNGRALVQFDTWNNIGWYDIEVDCLRVVPKPDPAAAAAKGHDAKKEAPRAAAKPAAGAAAAPGEKKLSPLEMARMQGAAKGGAAPAKPAAAKPAAPAAGGKKSVADILAAARANKPAGGAPAASAAAPAAAEPAEEPAAEAAPAPVAAKPAGKTTLKPGQRPSVPEILAWCREHDTK